MLNIVGTIKSNGLVTVKCKIFFHSRAYIVHIDFHCENSTNSYHIDSLCRDLMFATLFSLLLQKHMSALKLGNWSCDEFHPSIQQRCILIQLESKNNYHSIKAFKPYVQHYVLQIWKKWNYRKWKHIIPQPSGVGYKPRLLWLSW